MSKKIELDENFLREEFLIKKKQIKEIAKELGITSVIISREIKEKLKINTTLYRVSKNRIKHDLKDRKIGSLTIISASYPEEKGKYKWKCKCDCGKIVYRQTGHLLNEQYDHSCGCLKNLKGKKSHNWKGYEDISGTWFTQAKIGAKARKIKWKISIEDIWEQYLKQNGKCFFTGIQLDFKSGRDNGNTSLDRIDSKKGYTKDNIQLVLTPINFMKWTFSQSEFLKWIEIIYFYKKEKENEYKLLCS